MVTPATSIRDFIIGHQIPVNHFSLTALGNRFRENFPYVFHQALLEQYGTSIAILSSMISNQLYQSAIQIEYTNESIKYTAIFMAVSMIPMMASGVAFSSALTLIGLDNALSLLIAEGVFSVINGWLSALIIDDAVQDKLHMDNKELRDEAWVSGALGGLFGFAFFKIHAPFLMLNKFVRPISNILASVETSLTTSGVVSRKYNQKFDAKGAAISGIGMGAMSMVDIPITYLSTKYLSHRIFRSSEMLFSTEDEEFRNIRANIQTNYINEQTERGNPAYYIPNSENDNDSSSGWSFDSTEGRLVHRNRSGINNDELSLSTDEEIYNYYRRVDNNVTWGDNHTIKSGKSESVLSSNDTLDDEDKIKTWVIKEHVNTHNPTSSSTLTPELHKLFFPPKEKELDNSPIHESDNYVDNNVTWGDSCTLYTKSKPIVLDDNIKHDKSTSYVLEEHVNNHNLASSSTVISELHRELDNSSTTDNIHHISQEDINKIFHTSNIADKVHVIGSTKIYIGNIDDEKQINLVKTYPDIPYITPIFADDVSQLKEFIKFYPLEEGNKNNTLLFVNCESKNIIGNTIGKNYHSFITSTSPIKQVGKSITADQFILHYKDGSSQKWYYKRHLLGSDLVEGLEKIGAISGESVHVRFNNAYKDVYYDEHEWGIKKNLSNFFNRNNKGKGKEILNSDTNDVVAENVSNRNSGSISSSFSKKFKLSLLFENGSNNFKGKEKIITSFEITNGEEVINNGTLSEINNGSTSKETDEDFHSLNEELTANEDIITINQVLDTDNIIKPKQQLISAILDVAFGVYKGRSVFIELRVAGKTEYRLKSDNISDLFSIELFDKILITLDKEQIPLTYSNLSKINILIHRGHNNFPVIDSDNINRYENILSNTIINSIKYSTKIKDKINYLILYSFYLDEHYSNLKDRLSDEDVNSCILDNKQRFMSNENTSFINQYCSLNTFKNISKMEKFILNEFVSRNIKNPSIIDDHLYRYLKNVTYIDSADSFILTSFNEDNINYLIQKKIFPLYYGALQLDIASNINILYNFMNKVTPESLQYMHDMHSDPNDPISHRVIEDIGNYMDILTNSNMFDNWKFSKAMSILDNLGNKLPPKDFTSIILESIDIQDTNKFINLLEKINRIGKVDAIIKYAPNDLNYLLFNLHFDKLDFIHDNPNIVNQLHTIFTKRGYFNYHNLDEGSIKSNINNYVMNRLPAIADLHGMSNGVDEIPEDIADIDVADILNKDFNFSIQLVRLLGFRKGDYSFIDHINEIEYPLFLDRILDNTELFSAFVKGISDEQLHKVFKDYSINKIYHLYDKFNILNDRETANKLAVLLN